MGPRDLADERCSESAGREKAKKATFDRPIYTDSAGRSRPGSGSKSREGSRARLRSRSGGSRSEDEDDDEDSRNLEERLTAGSLESSSGVDDRSHSVGRFRKAEFFLKKVLRENVSEGCDRLLKGIREGQSLLKKNIQRSPKLRKRDTKDSPLSLKKGIQENALFYDNRSNQHNPILKGKEDIRENLKKGVQGSPLLLKSDNQESSLYERNEQQSPVLLKKDIKDTPLLLQKDIQEKVLLIGKSDQRSPISLKGNDQRNPLLLKEDTKQSALLRETSNHQSPILVKKDNQESPLTPKKDIEKNRILLKKDFQRSPLLPQKNIRQSALLTERNKQRITLKKEEGRSGVNLKEDIQRSPRLVKKDVPEVALLAKNNSEESPGLSKKDVSPQLSKKYTSSGLLMQLTRKENIQKSPKTLKKVLDEGNSSLQQIKVIPESPRLNLTEGAIQDNLLLTEEFCSLDEKKNQENPVPIPRLKRIKSDLLDLSGRSSIVHRRCLLSGNIHQVFQGVKNTREQYKHKLKRSPPLEEADWSGRRSTEADNARSADKRNSRCGLADSSHCAECQSIAKRLEEQITIFERKKRVSSCPEELVGISKEDSELDSSVESIESVSKVYPFNHLNTKEDPEEIVNLVIKIDDANKTQKDSIIEEEIAVCNPKRPFVKVDVQKEALNSSVVKIDIDNLPASKIINDIEAPDNQRAIRKNSRRSSGCKSRGHLIDPLSPLVTYPEGNSEKASKNSLNEVGNLQRIPNNLIRKADNFDKHLKYLSARLEDPEETLNSPSIKVGYDSSPSLKIFNDLITSDTQRTTQKDSWKRSSHKDRRPSNVSNLQLSLIRQKLSEGSRRTCRKNPRMKLTIRLIRIRDKLVLALSAFAILFTLLLVMDLQMDLGYSGHHLVPSHARVKLGDGPDADTVYNNFRRKFLQRANGSREQADATPGIEKSGKGDTTPPSSTLKKHDDFGDLVDLVVNGYGMNVDEGVARISGEDHEYNPTIGELRKVAFR